MQAPSLDDVALARRLVVAAGKILRLLGLTEGADLLDETWCREAEALRRDTATMRLNDGHFFNIGHYVITAGLAHFVHTGRVAATRIEAAPGPLANRFLREAFRPYVGESSGEELDDMVETICGNRRHLLADGSTITASRLMSEAAGEWFASGRPFLEIDDAVVERGWRALAPFGVTPDTPIVTLHVRESKWKADLGNFLHYGSRNAELTTYVDTIRDLTARGAFVVRLGDRTMSQAPALDRFLDYPHSALKSEWMDFFLASRALFHVGTSSGMSLTPLLFAKPVVFTNWAAFDEMLDPPNAVTIFKVLRDMAGRAIPVSDLGRGQGYLRTLMDVGVLGCFPEDNDAADIRDAVRFMADAVDWQTGSFDPPADAFDASRKAFEDSSFGIAPRIAPGFWARHFAEDLPPLTRSMPGNHHQPAKIRYLSTADS